ncbi:YihY/virulence factor BrkB family protein [Pseudonocardia humida]|uniref:YihY/virulence factor BrkB family protein n=1 Tax=Pseudonocardia humida TaxID=2800819 RepID=A0ABT1AE40_9PSEU|nr:YihY/virulence factor BrkB family protein [Pseudonocardia humida]MCO1660904.1 YihY/virulence factor BrkB family protein [Pseudonocardia humida]
MPSTTAAPAAGPPSRSRRARWRARTASRTRAGWALAREVAGAALADRLPGLAAETAFFAVLGIFPALLLGTGLLGVLDLVVGADLAAAAQREVVSALDAVLTEQAGPVIDSVRALFATSRGGLLTAAAVGALVTVSGAFATVIGALNLAYDVEERRSWLRRRLLGSALGVGTLVAGVLALAALVVGPLLGAGSAVADAVGLGPAFAVTWDVLRGPVVALLLLAWTATMYRLAPNRRSRWRDTVPGALLATAWWAAASAGFHGYLAVAAGANPVIGAFGGGVIVMIWVYLLSLGLLLGGELNAVLVSRARRGTHGERGSGGPAR